MLFQRCSKPGCKQLSQFRNLRLCLKHYQHDKYLERQIKAVQSDPSVATKAISICLKQFQILRDGGQLDQLEFAHLQRRFLGINQQLIAVISDDYETQEMTDADEQYAEQMLKDGAIEADSLEEAVKIFEAADRQDRTLKESRQKQLNEKEAA